MLHSLKFPPKKTGSHLMIPPHRSSPWNRCEPSGSPHKKNCPPSPSWDPRHEKCRKSSENKTNWGPIMGPNLFGIFFHFWGECFLHFLIGPMENWCHLGFCWVELPSLFNEQKKKFMDSKCIYFFHLHYSQFPGFRFPFLFQVHFNNRSKHPASAEAAPWWGRSIKTLEQQNLRLYSRTSSQLKLHGWWHEYGGF